MPEEVKPKEASPLPPPPEPEPRVEEPATPEQPQIEQPQAEDAPVVIEEITDEPEQPQPSAQPEPKIEEPKTPSPKAEEAPKAKPIPLKKPKVKEPPKEPEKVRCMCKKKIVFVQIPPKLTLFSGKKLKLKNCEFLVIFGSKMVLLNFHKFLALNNSSKSFSLGTFALIFKRVTSANRSSFSFGEICAKPNTPQHLRICRPSDF